MHKVFPALMSLLQTLYSSTNCFEVSCFSALLLDSACSCVCIKQRLQVLICFILKLANAVSFLEENSAFSAVAVDLSSADRLISSSGFWEEML